MVELRPHPQSKERARTSLHLRMRAPAAYPTLTVVRTHQPEPREGQAGPAGWRRGS